MNLHQQLAAARVLPVVTADDIDTTLQVARALSAGGMTVIEITLRTEAALDCLAAVKEAQPELLIAAGTVTSAADVERAARAGADLCVSPGVSEALLSATAEISMPFLPGVATASDIMLGTSCGLTIFKLFPAAATGGIALLQSFQGPFPGVQFCPTGGLSEENFREYLALPNVLCCGGSWMVSSSLVDNQQWEEITSLARAAVQNN